MCQISFFRYDQISFKMSNKISQAKKEHLSAYFRPLPPSLALKQDGEAAWALVSSHQLSNHNLSIKIIITASATNILIAVSGAGNAGV